MSWTDERIDALKRMWDGGQTATQIAEELGGVSRNAVIGKAHRLGLPARPSPVKPNENKIAAAASAPAEPRPAPPPRAPAPERVLACRDARTIDVLGAVSKRYVKGPSSGQLSCSIDTTGGCCAALGRELDRTGK